jgi:hypothetical protein
MECDMKKTLILSMMLLAFSLPAAADTIIFKDGMRIEAPHVWEENAEVRCEIGGIVFGYPKTDVERIEKGQSTVKVKKAEATVIKVHKEETVVPEEKASVPKKEEAAAKKETGIPEKEASVPTKPKAASQKAAATPLKKKAVPAKKMPASKKEKPSKTASPQYAGIPMFKEIINEDDNNPPAYIKRRRVLLVARGLAKARIKALLLSYEKKLRNELNAQKAKYKLIVVWVYDDFVRADEGAAGWIGMIFNEQNTGKLSGNPALSIR